MRYSIWKPKYMCGDHELSWLEKMDSNGVCPVCGHDSNSTVCSTKKIIYRNVYHRPWYIFWEIPTIEYK